MKSQIDNGKINMGCCRTPFQEHLKKTNLNVGKKFRIFLPIFITVSMLTCFQAQANMTGARLDLPSKEVITHMTKEEKEALVIQMNDRVKEIKAMDKSGMTRKERKALRMELKGMHKASQQITGVYISIGALIIIILLLIIIL